MFLRIRACRYSAHKDKTIFLVFLHHFLKKLFAIRFLSLHSSLLRPSIVRHAIMRSFLSYMFRNSLNFSRPESSDA